ncbi:hypothetical protein [Streptomyces sp. NPDC086989]|uniref:hypothetical protein n=1 Tax=Streptomyces sp. NPDC086989 TaxID=3365764 RepID=UPI0038277721
MNISGMDWGTLPAWVSAAGSSAALLATTYIIGRDRGDKHRTDANRVSCWMFPPTPEETRIAGRDGEDLVIVVQVKNASDRPVFDVECLTWAPHPERMGDRPLLVADVLKASDGNNEAAIEVPYSSDIAVPAPAAVTFRDADGRRWLRDLTTRDLHRIPEHRPRRGLVRRLRIRRQMVRHIGLKALSPGYVRRSAFDKRPWQSRRNRRDPRRMGLW